MKAKISYILLSLFAICGPVLTATSQVMLHVDACSKTGNDCPFGCKTILHDCRDIDCCMEFDYCILHNPCKHGSTCIDLSGGYSCVCLPNYIGKDCEIRDVCTQTKCIYGKCEMKGNAAICSCAAGFTGKACDTDINECAINPCLNNGTCLNHHDGYSCTCMTGYTGTNCQIDIECRSNPCLNGGICVDASYNGHICHCKDGFTGLNCETAPSDMFPPKIILDKNVTFSEGKVSASVACFVEGIPPPIVTWSALEGQLRANTHQLVHYLIIKNVTMQNEGLYVCTASNQVGTDIKVIDIKIKAKSNQRLHTAPIVITPSVVNAYYHTEAKLTCNATGYPYPMITWEHKQVVIQSSGNIFTIRNVTNATIGVYTCIATNDAGTYRANILLKAQFDPPKITVQPLPFVALVGQSHNFTCIATGHPIPKIKWEFQSFSHPKSGMPLHATSPNNTHLMMLHIDKSGTLTCTAENEFGKTATTVNVIVRRQGPAVG